MSRKRRSKSRRGEAKRGQASARPESGPSSEALSGSSRPEAEQTAGAEPAERVAAEVAAAEPAAAERAAAEPVAADALAPSGETSATGAHDAGAEAPPESSPDVGAGAEAPGPSESADEAELSAAQREEALPPSSAGAGLESLSSERLAVVDEVSIAADASDEDAIEVADEELEMAEAPGAASSPSVRRSLPPVRPSVRARAPGLSLPPPRRPSRISAAPPPPLGRQPAVSSLPPARTEAERWERANQRLELGRAQARIAELEEQLAYREARIETLESELAAARSGAQELERRLRELELARPASTGQTGESGSGANGQGGSSTAEEASGVYEADASEGPSDASSSSVDGASGDALQPDSSKAGKRSDVEEAGAAS